MTAFAVFAGVAFLAGSVAMTERHAGLSAFFAGAGALVLGMVIGRAM